ncbi:MAG: long-chain fatty acid--CoA ligase [Desulfobulbaceae bacterium A2]|nr:MAG: long-chain fatty acid--CoA ligase [Desulfobulbaceae bacterium A2]
MPTTINELFDGSVARFADLPAVGMALETPWSYREFSTKVHRLTRVLHREGVDRGSHVALLGENSPQWVLAYLATVRLGAVVVPILPDVPAADVRHILGETMPTIVFVTERQLEKLYDAPRKPALVVTLDDHGDGRDILPCLPFSDFLARVPAAELHDSVPETPPVAPEDLASILYTSGTSGFSKAVLLTHRNLTSNALSASHVFNIPPETAFLSVLPISHAYEFTVGFLLPLYCGARIAYVGKAPTPAVLQKVCREERPSIMLVVPLIMEKIYKKRVLPALEKSPLLEFICRFSWSRRLVYRRIGKKLLEFFGGNLVLTGIGGAALNPEVELFLREANFPFLVGYGLSEASPLLAGGPENDPTIAPGSTGKPVFGVEIRIDSPDPATGVGEIQARGPNIMQGYVNDPESTAKALTEDHWLRTGDLGCLDAHGNLHIKGRSKNVIVLANGENVYPEAIEHKLNASPYVAESLVMEQDNSLVAWIYPDYDLLDQETQGQDRRQRHEYLAERIAALRTEVNTHLPASSRISRILERREPFTKTATHKIKRYLYQAGELDA